jgi:hypothetical protein
VTVLRLEKGEKGEKRAAARFEVLADERRPPAHTAAKRRTRLPDSQPSHSVRGFPLHEHCAPAWFEQKAKERGQVPPPRSSSAGRMAMSAAGRALLAARLAGVTVTRNGDRIDLAADRKATGRTPREPVARTSRPSSSSWPTERCRACRGLGTADRPLIECCYAGHWAAAASGLSSRTFPTPMRPRLSAYAPRRVCDYCGQPGGPPGKHRIPRRPDRRSARALEVRGGLGSTGLNAIPLRVFM